MLSATYGPVRNCRAVRFCNGIATEATAQVRRLCAPLPKSISTSVVRLWSREEKGLSNDRALAAGFARPRAASPHTEPSGTARCDHRDDLAAGLLPISAESHTAHSGAGARPAGVSGGLMPKGGTGRSQFPSASHTDGGTALHQLSLRFDKMWIECGRDFFGRYCRRD